MNIKEIIAEMRDLHELKDNNFVSFIDSLEIAQFGVGAKPTFLVDKIPDLLKVYYDGKDS